MPKQGQWNTSNSGGGRRTPGSSVRPPMDGEFVVSGRHYTAHVVHMGYPTVVGRDCPVPNTKSYHQQLVHRPARDPVEGGGGADRHPSAHEPPFA